MAELVQAYPSEIRDLVVCVKFAVQFWSVAILLWGFSRLYR